MTGDEKCPGIYRVEATRIFYVRADSRDEACNFRPERNDEEDVDWKVSLATLACVEADGWDGALPYGTSDDELTIGVWMRLLGQDKL